MEEMLHGCKYIQLRLSMVATRYFVLSVNILKSDNRHSTFIINQLIPLLKGLNNYRSEFGDILDSSSVQNRVTMIIGIHKHV